MKALNDFNKVGIIGCGNVGTAMGILMREEPWMEQILLYSRTLESAKMAAKAVGSAQVSTTLKELIDASNLIIIAVSDDELESLVSEIVESEAELEGKLIFHTSGAKSSELLQEVHDKGAYTASFHPLQTFSDPKRAADRFDGTYCAIETPDREVWSVLVDLTVSLGGVPFVLKSHVKTVYHAAAVMSCNYLTALIDASLQLFAKTKVDEQVIFKAVAPMIDETIKNIFKKGPVGSLTGPIARGDVHCVEQHLDALEQLDDKSFEELYRLLGKFAVQLAERQETINPQQRDELLRLLDPSEVPTSPPE